MKPTDLKAADLPIESQAGQRLMVGFDGTEPDATLRDLVRTLRIGGVILFSRNISSPEQVKALCAWLQQTAAEAALPPLFIAVDQEGGPVARLKAPFSAIPAASSQKSAETVAHYARITAAELGSVGINMNMAPVLDIAPAGIQSIMAERSFGSDPETVSRSGSRVIDTLQAAGIMAVAKHFPGIGRTTLDSHLDMPALDAELASLGQFDLIPFQNAVARDVAGVMLSHIFYPQIDPEWPASLSGRIAGDLLRRKLGYQGLILTDDLDMGAIKKHFDLSTVVRRILLADIDTLLICHAGPHIEQAFSEILGLLRAQPQLHTAGMQSVNRILRLKARYLAA
jgi:beta-N-acetylhexosaminidase